ncbi:MAG: F-type H+-transporting ATPase subunit delta [Pelagibacterales bacterium]|nr:F-type H+-transporting ATPase subunit delta [Pelagibacterales bacterium]
MSSKSTFSNSTSSSYALALYELAKEVSSIENVEKEMIGLKKLIKESFDFKEIILNPMIEKNDKKNIIVKIAEKNNFSNTSKKFLGFVATKNRLFFLEKIIGSFLNLVSKSKGELKAQLISSKELSTNEQKKIQDELSKDFKSSLNIKYKYDPDLIGGLIIQINSVMVDTSIKTKLKKLEKSMLEA